MNDQDPNYLPLRELGRRLRAGELSPVELAEHSLNRLASLGPRFNAVVTLTRERAVEQARRAEAELRQGRARGPLHGIPYGAKDLLATSGGIPTTWGFEPLKHQVFDEDAAVIERLETAGAVLVAKLAMVELAGGMKYNQPNATFTGPGINPWNEHAWSGGSSSGSASAVAAGLVPFAIGTETIGSIIGPATFCGLTALRPGFGRVSRRGAMALSWSLDKIGPLCHTAEDCGLVFEAIAGPDPRDPETLPEPFQPVPPPDRKWRLCLIEDMEQTDQPAVMENFQASLDVLRPLADFQEHPLPVFPYQETLLTILFAEAGASFSELCHNGWAERLTAPETRTTPYALQTIPAVDYIQALRLRQRIHREITAWLAGVDAIVTPTQLKVAPPLDSTFSDYWGPHRRTRLVALANLVGLPCVTVHNGFGERGLPTALQFVGTPGSEGLLLAMAHGYQQRTDWHLRHPELG